ncbi:hypothetical protein ACPOL_3233 [Acidisarcina polymorpha]|uniref:Uncharacterized protein n=1 Tax=Acidisarcina polymorpha TaxID=2211140 RepID=A0A2Z5G078_9BACT|nr:hypothetical protein [Acidisarcina polymorpha]AXC12528.1 hypothetical protein ACPOL_3233 [Acidisarcina polymorpha]
MQTNRIIAELDAEIARLQEIKSVLSGTTPTAAKRKPGRPRLVAAPAAKTRQLSTEARARIAAAQKARWAKARKAAKATA